MNQKSLNQGRLLRIVALGCAVLASAACVNPSAPILPDHRRNRS